MAVNDPRASGVPVKVIRSGSSNPRVSGAPVKAVRSLISDERVYGAPVKVIRAPVDVIPADRDAGVFVEVWNRPNTERIVAAVPVTTGGVDVQQYRLPPGDGAITIPAGYDRLSDIYNPSTTVEPMAATGGTKSTPGDGYVYHRLDPGDSLTVTRAGVCDILVVGGGGGGGGVGYSQAPSGGGGGGEPLLITNTVLGTAVYPVIGGAGGAGGAAYGDAATTGAYAGEVGEDTTFAGFTARGGGGGAGDASNAAVPDQPPTSGYSGGGAGWSQESDANNSPYPGASGVPGGGGRGGDSDDFPTGGYHAGGGGGAGGDGNDGDNADLTDWSGNGGPGVFIAEFDQFGESGWFGGGGGGGIYGQASGPYVGVGGIGGGGGGNPPSQLPGAGQDGTGGGGSGQRGQSFAPSSNGNPGGDGAVYVRYAETATAPIRNFVKVFDSGLYRYGFWPERVTRPYDDQQLITVQGRGHESMTDWAPLPPPAWNYGYDTGYFQNFVNPPDLLSNGGYYEPLEGAFGDPTPGWSARGSADHTACTSCTTGSFGNVIRVVPSATHTGIQQTVDVEGGARYKFRTWIEGSVTGQRITITMNFNGEAASGATAHTANTFVYPSGSDNILAELGNVARNPAANGCPGGSTDGTVQYTELDVTIPAGCDTLTVQIQSDHHSGCGGPGNQTFYVHGAALEGIGAGMPDEFAPGGDPVLWDTGASVPISGDYSWQWRPEDTGTKVTLVGPIDATTDEAYFAQFAAYKVGGPPGNVRAIVYGNDASTIIADSGWTAATGSLQYIDVGFTGPGSGQVYLGVAVQNTTGLWWFDEVAVFSGRPPASPGAIIGDMLAAVQALGFLEDLTIDFNDAADSNGELWRSTSIAADFGYGGSLMAALNRIATMGYEWTVEAIDQRFGYDTGHVLRLFNGYGTTG